MSYNEAPSYLPLGGGTVTGTLSITGHETITGNTDAVQLSVKGNATQTNDIFKILKSDNTPLFEVVNTGDVTCVGILNSDTYIQSQSFRNGSINGTVGLLNTGSDTSASSIAVTSTSGGITLTAASTKNVTVTTSGGGVFVANGLSGASGTGSFAGTTSPSFTTPVLGTPTSGTLTNCTGYNANNLAGNTLNSGVTASSLTSFGNFSYSSFSPTLGDGSNRNFTTSHSVGRYFSIGNVTYFCGAFVWSSKASASGIIFLKLGIPITSLNVSNIRQTITLGTLDGFAVSGSQFTCTFNENTDCNSTTIGGYMISTAVATGTVSIMTDASFASTGEVAFSGFLLT